MTTAPPTVHQVSEIMGRIAPLECAESWDRVGLLVGERNAVVSGPIMLTIDLTPAVLDEAIAARASMIVAYHPPIWNPLKRITCESVPERTVLRAIRAGIALYSPHTALDAVPGGVADWLCKGLGGRQDASVGDCRALTPFQRRSPTADVKIVTFVPFSDADRVRESLASAGAGIIGNYQVCSFESAGHGTFLGSDTAKPAIGRAGVLERVAEVRIEMVCSKAALPLALETLRRFHPYEQPAIDVYDLAPLPDRYIGLGRRLVLDHPATVGQLGRRLKSALNITDLRIAVPGEDVPVDRVGACPGSGSDLAPLARQAGCQVYVTGEMSHHEVMSCLHGGMAVILAGHTNTERGYLPVLADRMMRESAAMDLSIRTLVSTADRDPLVTV
jgi:dinuclear metal center YbgI/SA1388 family protein